jgi:ketosteroid isomerase-like protein
MMRREELNKSLVDGLANALNDHDMVRAREYLSDDLHFVGVFGPPIDGADAYLAAMERIGAHQTILKSFAEGDDVACFYQLSVSGRPDAGLFGCGWFTIERKRIKLVRVVFDPTPLGKA